VIDLDRLNAMTSAAVLGGEPEALTDDERPTWEAIRDQVRAEPDVVWCPVYDA